MAKQKKDLPAHKKLYGDVEEAARFAEIIARKFGTKYGAAAEAIYELDITSRRVYNMYLSAQRRIPPEVMERAESYVRSSEENVDPLS